MADEALELAEALAGLPERARAAVEAEMRARMPAAPRSPQERAQERAERAEEEAREAASPLGQRSFTAGIMTREF